jgi:lysine-specific demethylase 8
VPTEGAVDVDAIAAMFATHAAADEGVGRPDPAADLRQLFTRTRPLVMRGLARGWPAFERWTFDHLARLGSGITVSVNRSIREQYATTSEECDLGEYIRGIQADDGTVRGGTDQRYLAYSWLVKDLPQLRADIPFRDEFGPRTHKLPATWIGPAGTVTGLHSDNVYPNVLAQIRGRKSVVLFAPGSPMYTSGKYESWTSVSSVDLRAPDFDRFPSLRGASPLVAHLDEGDALFIPPKWWHFVVADTPSVSVSTFFGTPRHVAPAAAVEITKGLLHRVGLYRRGDCICHSRPFQPTT